MTWIHLCQMRSEVYFDLPRRKFLLLKIVINPKWWNYTPFHVIFSSKVHCGLFPAEDFLLCGECSRHVWLLLDTGPYNKLLLFDISHSFGRRHLQPSWAVHLLLYFYLRRKTRHSLSWNTSSLIPVKRIEHWSDQRCTKCASGSQKVAQLEPHRLCVISWPEAFNQSLLSSNLNHHLKIHPFLSKLVSIFQFCH